MSRYAEYLVDVLTRHGYVIHQHVDDLTLADTLANPAGGNNMNWVLGHLAVHREHMMGWLGIDLPWAAGAYVRYDRGSERLEDAAEAVDLAQVLGDLDKSQVLLAERLLQTDEDSLNARIEGLRRDLGGQLGFYLWHEAYHVGQLELLRHAAGRHESLI